MDASGQDPPVPVGESATPRRPPGLRAKLVLFGVLLTLGAVSSSFIAFNIEIRRQTKRLLAENLARQQSMIRDVESRRIEQLLRTSTSLTASPTLRAAVEIYRTESLTGTATRDDLLATIGQEVEQISETLGRDLLVVTDERGRVLAASARSGPGPRIGEDLAVYPVVRHALRPSGPVDRGNLDVVEIGSRPFSVGTAPIVLQGFVIGSLVLGDHLDDGYIEQLRQQFACDIVLRRGDRVLGSTLDRLPGHAELTDALDRFESSPTGSSPLLTLGGEDYVVAPLMIGAEEETRASKLYLLHSLSRELGNASRTLLLAALGIGLVAVVLAGLAAVIVSRSLLRPLTDFVAFMGSIAESGGGTRPYDRSGGGREVRTLVETYNQLVASLEEHERRRTTQAREELDRLERLKESEKLAALGRMLSGAAHEINNPLTGVVGNIEVVLEDATLPARPRARLETVRREGRRIVSLVRNLLKVAHRSTGEQTVVDLTQLAREVVALRQHDFANAGVTLELVAAARPVPVSGNELELQQVLINIVGNALDALRVEVEAPRLTLGTEVADGHAVLTFTDNGPGISHPERVFEHFFTTKPVGQGTGLGLSICHAVVGRHDGTIRAENHEAGGARFTVTLPLAATESRPRAAVDTVGPSARPARDLDATVLVVDDEPSVLELQMVILDSLGADAVGVSSGSEAIDCLRRREFDLIVSDLRMPGDVSGRDLFDWVSRHRPEARGRFLFVTGDTLEEAPLLEESGVRCVLKPFTLEEYTAALEETLHVDHR